MIEWIIFVLTITLVAFSVFKWGMSGLAVSSIIVVILWAFCATQMEIDENDLRIKEILSKEVITKQDELEAQYLMNRISHLSGHGRHTAYIYR